MRPLAEDFTSFNPTTLTLDEYLKVVNSSNKFHEDHAYDCSLEDLNRINSKEKYTKLVRNLRVNNLDFQVRMAPPDAWDKNPIAIFNDEGEKVGAVDDEWGCVLVRVAREYRGFGFGVLLVKMIRTLEPSKTSGGFTPSGYRNFVKVYREMVRDALKSGFYTQQVKSGKLTIDRVKEIVASAKLENKLSVPQKDYASNDPKNWLLYIGGYGDFILYDKKLKDHLNGKDNDFWIDKMVKGTILIRESNKSGLVVQFGGDTDKIKTFMMSCGLSHCFQEGMKLWVDPEDKKFVNPEFGRVAPVPNLKSGYKRYMVTPLKTIDTQAFGYLEKRYRESFDQHNEFLNQMLELGFSKFEAV